jgi:hypothetical protein
MTGISFTADIVEDAWRFMWRSCWSGTGGAIRTATFTPRCSYACPYAQRRDEFERNRRKRVECSYLRGWSPSRCLRTIMHRQHGTSDP